MIINENDRKDNEILWGIYVKTKNRANAKLTDEEKSCLDRLGLERDSYSKSIKLKDCGQIILDYNFERNMLRRRMSNNKIRNSVNFADRARKIGNRTYAQIVNSLCGYWDKNKNRYINSFIAKERIYINLKMEAETKQIIGTIRNKNYYKKKLDELADEYAKKREELLKEFKKIETEEKIDREYYSKQYNEYCKRLKNKMEERNK